MVTISRTASYLHDPHVQLMLRVRSGDCDAFRDLVEAFDRRLQSFLSQRIGDQDVVDDLKQEVYLRVYRARSAYQPRARFSTWLFTIANNVARNRIRDNRHREIPFSAITTDGQSDMDATNVADDSLAGPDTQAEAVESESRVHNAIDQLPAHHRSAVIMRFFHGRQYDEIATELDSTRDAVKGVLTRARESLRRRLQPTLLQ